MCEWVWEDTLGECCRWVEIEMAGRVGAHLLA